METLLGGGAEADGNDELSRRLRAKTKLGLISMSDEELWELARVTSSPPERPPELAYQNYKQAIEKLRATKETLERVVERGYVENEAQQILVSTAALLWDFLRGKSVDSELRIRVEERQRDVGLFFPPLVEAILEWVKEGRQSIIEKIKVLDGS